MSTRSALLTGGTAAALLLGTLAGCSSDADEAATDSAAGSSTGAESSDVAGIPFEPDPEDDGGVGGTTAPVPSATPQTSQTPQEPAAVDVVLTFAAWDPAASVLAGSGYVQPVIEDGGTCTLELTRGGTRVTATSDGFADATTTVCSGLEIPGAELAAGGWTAVLRYESATAEGESEPLTVQVSP